MRRMAAALALAAGITGPAAAEVRSARFTEPTTRYAHAVLGDAVEWGALELQTGSATITLRLPETRVFEDLAPRLADVDDDGDREVIVVESDLARGARLAIYDASGLLAATPFIGTPNRWLAPVGAADLDGDGRIEIAYVDRPHLAKSLRLWRLDAGQLVELASLDGVTNYQIGWDVIAGGLRDCGGGPEIVLASGDWTRRVAVRFDGTRLTARDLGPLSDPRGLAALCP